MSEKKARASVFFVIAIIAFVCSCILFSMTGGVYDWVGDAFTNDTDNTTDDFGLSELLENESSNSYTYDSSEDNSSDSSDSSSFLDDLTNRDKQESSSSDSSDSSKSSDSSDSSKSSDSSSENNPMN